MNKIDNNFTEISCTMYFTKCNPPKQCNNKEGIKNVPHIKKMWNR